MENKTKKILIASHIHTLDAIMTPPAQDSVGELEKQILQSARELNDMEKELKQLEATTYNLQPTEQQTKLKKGLAVHHIQADGVTYKQGKAGLERVTNTNRNDKCNCGSGKKFKKCCGR